MAAEVVARTRSGSLRGRREADGTIAFRGVHYAAPPIGPHYLGLCAPVEPWEGVHDALDNAASPAQPSLPGHASPLPGSDYLNVNIFTPELGDVRLPVFVWFCVGGFVICNNASPTVNGNAFARDGVVAVTVNHRIGAEGYAIIDGAPDNRGTLDWLACLEWLQENIAAFGGDSGRITIGGCSAGGATCFYLMSMARARGLFHRAIALSGPPASPDRAAAQERNARFGRHIKMAMTRGPRCRG